MTYFLKKIFKDICFNAINYFRFNILFDNLKVYCNEERTRTFVGLKVQIGHSNLLNIIKMLDFCLKEFNLPAFYEVSIYLYFYFYLIFTFC